HSSPTALSPLSLHDALPICLHAPVAVAGHAAVARLDEREQTAAGIARFQIGIHRHNELVLRRPGAYAVERFAVFGIRLAPDETGDRKSTRLNSSHVSISYAV